MKDQIKIGIIGILIFLAGISISIIYQLHIQYYNISDFFIFFTSIILVFFLFFFATKTQERISTNLILNRYQVQVYDDTQDMIHYDIYEGFTREEAIQKANKFIQENKVIILKGKNDFSFPLKFHIST